MNFIVVPTIVLMTRTLFRPNLKKRKGSIVKVKSLIRLRIKTYRSDKIPMNGNEINRPKLLIVPTKDSFQRFSSHVKPNFLKENKTFFFLA